MFCTRCGQQIPDDARFCSHCGAGMNGKEPNPSPRNHGGMKTIVMILAVAVLLLAVLSAALIFGGQDTVQSAGNTPATTEREIKTPVSATPTVSEEVALPEGWYEEDGKTYFFEDGKYYVGLWEIDGAYYYFDDDGAMMRSTTAEDEDGYKVKLDSSGRMTDLCYPYYGGQWAAQKYNYGNGGHSSVMEYTTPIEDCTSVDLCVEAEGNYGASVNGNWKVHFKIDGKWKEITSFSYSGSSTTTHIEFPSPVTIEAITAYPTKQGNASYSCLYSLQNVWCKF